jgi:hypothetical protein
MADVTDPLLADHTGIDGADGLAAASRLQVGMFTRQCAGMRVLPAAAKQAWQAGGGLVLAAPGALVLRMLDRTGSMTGLLVDPTVEEAAGVASPQRAARPVPKPGARAIVAGLPTVRPGRQQEEGQRWPPPAAHLG